MKGSCMPKIDFNAYAAQLARTNGRQTMAPVIEKELLHYEILRAMEEDGLLGDLVFQGGTCLRLCYGASRYSEDLDFAGGFDFDAADLEALILYFMLITICGHTDALTLSAIGMMQFLSLILRIC